MVQSTRLNQPQQNFHCLLQREKSVIISLYAMIAHLTHLQQFKPHHIQCGICREGFDVYP